MQYVHKITGAVIDVESTMGGDWRPVKAAAGTTRAANSTAAKTQARKSAPKKAVGKNGRTVRKSG